MKPRVFVDTVLDTDLGTLDVDALTGFTLGVALAVVAGQSVATHLTASAAVGS